MVEALGQVMTLWKGTNEHLLECLVEIPLLLAISRKRVLPTYLVFLREVCRTLIKAHTVLVQPSVVHFGKLLLGDVSLVVIGTAEVVVR